MAAIDDATQVVQQRQQDSQMVASMLSSMSSAMRGNAGMPMDATPGVEGNLAAKSATPPAPPAAPPSQPATPATAPKAAPVGADLQAYMKAASAEESGGNPNVVNARTGAAGTFQIMPANWAQWAKDAGVDPGDRSAAAQQQVAAHKMQQYYDQFGSWGAVAVAWYAGPSAAASWLRNPTAKRFTVKQGTAAHPEPSINEYVDNIVGNMHTQAGQTPAQQPVAATAPSAMPAPAPPAPAAGVAPASEPGNPDLNAFTLAIAGGRTAGTTGNAGQFQIAHANYAPWAKEAGVDPADTSPQAQWKVASTQMAKYFEHYDDWGAVAAAWYAGPKAAAAWLKNPNDPQFNKPMNGNGPSVNQYVQQALAKMRQAVA